MVVNGQLILGLTDTDDACGAIKKGASVELIIPDQDKNDMGTLIIPNTVALVANAQNPEEARLLIDYLLSMEVEKQLIQSGWSQIPLRQMDIDIDCPDLDTIKGMNISLGEVYEQIERAKSQLKEVFVQ
jgi:iron(III) transport system substrate-binding protein